MYNDTSIDQLFVDAPVGSLGCYITLQIITYDTTTICYMASQRHHYKSPISDKGKTKLVSTKNLLCTGV